MGEEVPISELGPDGISSDGWHAKPAEDVLGELKASALGLSREESLCRLEIFGANRLPVASKKSPLLRFLRHFNNVLIYVLLGASVITAMLGHIVDTAVILAVVVVNAVIGFVQEGKAERAMEAIRHMLAPKATVLRDSQRVTVEGEEIVPGDIVLLEAGDRVPADLRLLQTRGLQIDEAILTGESIPSEKGIASVASESPLGDRACLAFSGTLVTSGVGRGAVVATGARTEIGRISSLLTAVEELTTPLLRQMNIFAHWLTVVILVVAAALLVFGYFVAHFAFAEMFMAVVGLSVAAIPEGLPAVLTITLAVGVQGMAARNAIVRRLPAIETLGSVSVICTDKTGTLTRNEMMVATIATCDHSFALDGLGYAPNGALMLGGEEADPKEYGVLQRLARAAMLCNDAALVQRDEVWRVEGDPMEGALLAAASKIGIDLKEDAAIWKRTDTIPFDSKHRFMATLNHDHQGNAIISVKGAPERIFLMCGSQQTADGGTAPFNAGYWQDRAEDIANSGQRVIAIAAKTVIPSHTVLEFDDVEESLTLLGLVGLIDPPRPEAIDAVAECQEAGIRIKMITGDHRGTAAAIGRQIGLLRPDRILTGAELDSMDDVTLAAAVGETDVFARTSPEHKLRLVMALQAKGMTVAMTGDGVNDAPALKRADAGIAMGQKGSEAAKEAAEIVLADDNFATIVAAVREGRTVYDNIKKVISWTLPTNAGEAMTIVAALLLGMTLPITPIQILWVNLITAVTLGIALAFEPTEPNTMKRPPRNPRASLLSRGLIWHIVLVSGLFLAGVFGIYSYAVNSGYSVDLARTMALNTLVVMEIFHLFFVRNIYGTSLRWRAVIGTRVVWATVIAVTSAQFAITYVPALQRIFSTEAISFIDGCLLIGIGVTLFAIIEIEKQIRLRLAGVPHRFASRLTESGRA